MAYISQEMKKKLAPGIKKVLKDFGMKGSISVRDHRVLVVTLKEGKIDFGKDDMQLHHYSSRNLSGKAKEFSEKIFEAMRGEFWYDNSDIQTDYFDTAYYMNVHVGRYDRPYVVKS